MEQSRDENICSLANLQFAYSHSNFSKCTYATLICLVRLTTYRILPIMLIELVRKVCEVLRKPMRMCCNLKMQKRRLRCFRLLLYLFDCLPQGLALSFCWSVTLVPHFFQTTTTDRWKWLEGRKSKNYIGSHVTLIFVFRSDLILNTNYLIFPECWSFTYWRCYKTL